MKSWVRISGRRIRAAFVITIVWGALWAIWAFVCLLVLWAFVARKGRPPVPPPSFRNFVILGTTLVCYIGLAAGLVFALIAMVAGYLGLLRNSPGKRLAWYGVLAGLAIGYFIVLRTLTSPGEVPVVGDLIVLALAGFFGWLSVKVAVRGSSSLGIGIPDFERLPPRSSTVLPVTELDLTDSWFEQRSDQAADPRAAKRPGDR